MANVHADGLGSVLQSQAGAAVRMRGSERIKLLLAALVVFVLRGPNAMAGEVPPDVVLRGTIQGKDNHTYRLIPFRVPPGMARITVDFQYTGKEEHTALDLGIYDPAGFRGWSGGNKTLFTISGSDATRSYLYGAIVPGQWKLLIAVPSIRPESKSEFTAQIYFTHSGLSADEPEVLKTTIQPAPGWYRGDLHSHTAHSDGSCDSQAGKSVPCPLFLTVQTAAKGGLDFLAITDHNTVSQFSEMRELQPFFDKTLLIPGREITTFQGHANLFGSTAFVDFRVSSDSVPSWNDLLQSLPPKGVALSVNHPARSTGEACMGCGWYPEPDVDWNLIHVLETVNSYDTTTAVSGLPFWQAKLNAGFRITGIGGGDNHNALASTPGPGSIGYPTTVVHADSLSIAAIIDAILAGHVFIDVTGSPDRLLEFTATSGINRAAMGDILSVPNGERVAFKIHLRWAAGGEIEIIQDGSAASLMPVTKVSQSESVSSFNWTSDGNRHWIRVNVWDSAGKLWLVGNPIYINFRR
jgi:hypothetical protein